MPKKSSAEKNSCGSEFLFWPGLRTRCSACVGASYIDINFTSFGW